MNSELQNFSQGQWRAISHLCSDVSQLGTMLHYEWPASPASPYMTERLAFSNAIEMEREGSELIDISMLYGRVFQAKPEGARYGADYGSGMRIEQKYRAIIEAFSELDHFQTRPRLPAGLRQLKREQEPAPMRAMNRARDFAKRCYTEERASLEAQRVLAEENMFPAVPLPIVFHVPRLRADGDWMIGALRRFKTAIEHALDLLVAANEFIQGGETILGDAFRKDAVAWKVVPILAGKPTLRQDELCELLSVSKKTAIATLTALENAGVATEIRGLEKWQVWTAADETLGLPKAA
ncbi:MAG: hypothetical protein AAF720_12240 [Pseudomonadota bacterium]